MNNKKILITGNKGYIAKNLEKHLSDKGFWIGGFDKKTGICAASFRLPKKSDIFAIIHLAATSGIEECNKDIEETIKNNVIAASNMFLVALENDIPIIFISSQAAKDHNSSVYAASKYYAECYASYYNLQGAKIRILRLSNVYGGIDYIEKKNSVVAKFLKAKKEGRSLIVNGDGSQVRDFVHVDDVCEAIYSSLYNLRDLEEIIEIGSGTGTSIISLAYLIGGRIEFNEKSPDIGVQRSVANLNHAIELLSFSPKKTLEEYISSF